MTVPVMVARYSTRSWLKQAMAADKMKMTRMARLAQLPTPPNNRFHVTHIPS